MKTNYKNFIIIIFLLVMMSLILLYPETSIETVLSGTSIFIKNVFPSLFPFFIITDLLSEYNFIKIITNHTRFLNKILKINKNSSYALIFSMISGFPSGAKLTKELLDKNLISLEEAQNLIRFTHFSNPIFIIGTVGSILLKNGNLALIILVSHFLGNFVMAILINERTKELRGIETEENHKSFITVLNNSITKTFNTLMLLLGIIITFLLIVSFINKLFNPNIYLKIIINGILEMTSGITLVSHSPFNLVTKGLIITIFLSFGGLSIHLQVMSILEDTKIEYKSFFKARILHSIISAIIYLVIINFMSL